MSWGVCQYLLLLYPSSASTSWGPKLSNAHKVEYFFHSTPSWWYDVYIISALWITDQCIHVLAAPGNKLPSEQGTEEDQEENGGDEKEIEEENKNRDEESHGLSDVSSDSSRVEKDKEPLAVSSQGLSAWRTDFKDVEDMNFFYYEVCEQNIRCFRRICLQGVRKETTLNVLCECSTSAQYDLVKTHDKDPFIWFLLFCEICLFSLLGFKQLCKWNHTEVCFWNWKQLLDIWNITRGPN